MSKRKRPEAKSSTGDLNEDEKTLLNLIRSKEGMGATKFEMKQGTSIPQMVMTRSITSLKKLNLIKEVQNPNNKGIKHFLAMEIEPSKDLTGGDWYTDGTLDIAKIEDLKQKCVLILHNFKHTVVTFEKISQYFLETEKLPKEQVQEILKNLILDNLIMDVKSNGLNEFAATRIGEICYKLPGKKSSNGEARVGTFASAPCGACPHIGLCSPNGVISPNTCTYFQKWLEF